MATKTATVNASDVPATQTNFPAYVDLSRVGITTLAEAQSVRCYSDEAKTTELAREIVSATEMHVKIPSLTSTFQIWVDYDGVRSDYAVTDTYGRNAVWSDYDFVSHDGGGTDSTGNHTTSNTGSLSAGGVSGQLGTATDFNGSSQFFSIDSYYGPQGSGDKFTSAWINTSQASAGAIIQMGDGGATGQDWMFRGEDNDIWGRFSSATIALVTDFNDGNWHLVRLVQTGTTLADMKLYSDTAVQNGSGSTVISHTNTADEVRIGNRQAAASYFDGVIDEVRIAAFDSSGNWHTTEYNNQSDEAGFWGTWTTAGGGGGGGAAADNAPFAGGGI